MPKEGTEIVDVELYLHHETPAAILISKGGSRREEQIWLPKKLIEYVVKHRNLIEVTMPQWLAYEKGLL